MSTQAGHSAEASSRGEADKATNDNELSLGLLTYKVAPEEFLKLRRYMLDLYRQLHLTLRPVDANYRQVCNRITMSLNEAILKISKSGFKPRGSEDRLVLIKEADELFFDVKISLDTLFVARVIPQSKKKHIAYLIANVGSNLSAWLKSSQTMQGD